MTEDNIKSPSHYMIHLDRLGVDVETIDLQRATLTKEEFIGAMKFNINKYVIRAGKKDGEPEIKDYKKAKVYIEWLIESLEEDNGNIEKD